MITQIAFGEEYISQNSSLCNVCSLMLFLLRSKYLPQHHQPVCCSMQVIKLYKHVKDTKFYFAVCQSLYVWTANSMMKNSGPNGSKHPINLICLWFLMKWIFHTSVLSPNTLNYITFSRYLLNLIFKCFSILFTINFANVCYFHKKL